MTETILTKTDHENTVDLTPGAEMVIELEENPTAGYRWTVEEPLPVGMGLVSTEFAPGVPAIGKGGLRRFRIHVDGPGEGTLSFKLWREWGGDSSVVDRFRATVRIQG